jgi:hypothetical protein
MNNAIWKKSRWNGLPTLWDGDATWCLQKGPAQGDTCECRLATNPPNERPKHSLVFRIHAPAAVAVLEELAKAATHCLSAQVGLGKLEEVGVVSDRFFQW